MTEDRGRSLNGQQVGAYQILSLLGAGGMGEVYRAKDLRLKREVAIKVLRDTSYIDAERLRRFEQEALAAARLNHPNIIAVHDVGTHNGAPYIVSELLKGETLRDYLRGRPLPVRKALDLALQVARGLGAAHEEGIVHRDLKPENLFVTTDGGLKILDFGLVKLIEPAEIGDTSIAASAAMRVTRAGAILGTECYMSPEQVRAEAVDHRSDIFSFGVVLYEMLAGRRAFERASAVETMHATLNADPPELPESVQAELPDIEPLLRHCLEKKPDERFQSARDVAFHLTLLLGTLGSRIRGRPLIAGHRRVRRYGAVAAVAMLVAAVAAMAGFVAGERAGKVPVPSYRQLTFQRGSILSARFAPDGRTIVYGAEWNGGPAQIFSTRVEGPESRPRNLLNTDILAISPQGEMAVLVDRQRQGGWATRGTLARLPLGGGAPREILDDVQDADWSPDGTNLAAVHIVSGKYRLEYPIGTVLYETDGWISHPRVSIDGERVAFIDHPISGDDRGDICVVGRDRQKATLSAEWASAFGLAWSSRGDEVWFTAAATGANAALQAVDLSGRQRVIAQSPGRLTLEDTLTDGRVLLVESKFRVAMKLRTVGDERERDLSLFDTSVVTDISMDGKTVLFMESGAGEQAGSYAVYMQKTDGSPAVRLGHGAGAAVSPDGQWAAAIVMGPSPHLVLLPTGAGGAKILEAVGPSNFEAVTWFPDGRRILFAGNEQGRGVRLYAQDIAQGRPVPISPEGIRITFAASPISPKGDRVAAVDRDRRIVIVSLDGKEPQRPAGADPGDIPIRWSGDGAALYVFREGELPGKVYRLDLERKSKALLAELLPSDPAGIRNLTSVVASSDGRSYVYSYSQNLSDLYLVDGLR